MEPMKVSRVIYVVLAVVTFLLALSSFRYFVSEFHSFQGKRYERFWESSGKISSTAQWERAMWQMERALDYNDRNPATLLRSARVLEWYIFTPTPDGQVIRTNLDAAAVAIDRALMLRPDDGSALSARAQLKARRWQIDQSLSADIISSYQLAPWERPVLRRLVYAAMAAWPKLDSRGRDLLVSLFMQSAEHRPLWALDILLIASDYGHLNDLCDRLSGLDFKDKGSVRDKQCPRMD